MSGRGRPPKRKLDEQQGQRRAKKEARTESIVLEVTDAAHLTLHTLIPDDFTYIEPSEDTEEEEEEEEDGMVSRGCMWKGSRESDHEEPPPQITLSCTRIFDGENPSCATQTFHFIPSELPPDPTSPVQESLRGRKTALPGINLESIKVEIDGGNQDFLNCPLACCVVGCGSRSDDKRNKADDSKMLFYTLPQRQEDRDAWVMSLDIRISEPKEGREQHVCSLHFLSPTKLIFPAPSKTKTRKKKTCDMLIAEEAEKIRQGLAGGRPKRTPKPNKNYDWAEIAPLIKAEPDEFDEVDLDLPTPAVDRSLSSHRRKQLHPPSIKLEDKENDPAMSDVWTEGEEGDEEDEEDEEEEYGADVSLPTSPRAPPPKPKGRPHRIRDNCCQTVNTKDMTSRSPQVPLREVKVQCGLSAPSPSSCPACAHIDWRRLEELLLAVIKGGDTESGMEWGEVKECVGVVLDAAPPHPPSHPTNVLKLLRGEEREPMESTKGIVLVAGHEGEEVEVENVIHPEVDEPMSGIREITPATWQGRKLARKRRNPGVPRATKTWDPPDEADEDRLGLEEATEKDEDEFQPGLGVEDEDEEELEEEEEEEEVEDEDWDVKKGDIAKPKKKRKKKMQKIKKEQNLVGREADVGKNTNMDGVAKHIYSTGCKSMSKGTKFEKEKVKKSKRQGKHTGKEAEEEKRKEHKCKECGEVFWSVTEAEVHVFECHSKPQYSCGDCDISFPSKLSLNVHRMFKHDAGRVYHCDQCDYEAPRLYHLKRHARVHTGERSFVCSVCGKGLKSSQALENHLVLHTNKGRFRCDVCNKAFNQRRAFEDHSSSHRLERNFTCQYCSITFKTYKHVACHVRAVHLKDKRFLCDVCGMRHMTGANLKTHMKTHRQAHTLPFTFLCHICDKGFRGAKGLSVHMEVIHQVKLKVEKAKSCTVEAQIQSEGSEGGQKRVVTLHPTRQPRKIDCGVTIEKKQTYQDGNEDIASDKGETVLGNVEEETEQNYQVWKLSDARENEAAEIAADPEERQANSNSKRERGHTILEERGPTVLVEGENFICEVNAEDIEFEF